MWQTHWPITWSLITSLMQGNWQSKDFPPLSLGCSWSEVSPACDTQPVSNWHSKLHLHWRTGSLCLNQPSAHACRLLAPWASKDRERPRQREMGILKNVSQRNLKHHDVWLWLISSEFFPFNFSAFLNFLLWTAINRFFFFLVELGIELRASHLQNKYSIAWAVPPVHFTLVMCVYVWY
jgi:hypothetical protein